MIISFFEFMSLYQKLCEAIDLKNPLEEIESKRTYLKQVLYQDPVMAQMADRFPPDPQWLSHIFPFDSQSVHFPIHDLRRKMSAEKLEEIVPMFDNPSLEEFEQVLKACIAEDMAHQDPHFLSPLTEKECETVLKQLMQSANEQDFESFQKILKDYVFHVQVHNMDFEDCFFHQISRKNSNFYDQARTAYTEWCNTLEFYENLLQYVEFLARVQLKNTEVDQTIKQDVFVRAVSQFCEWVWDKSPNKYDYITLFLKELEISRTIYQDQEQTFLESSDRTERMNQGCLKGLYEKILDLFYLGLQQNDSERPQNPGASSSLTTTAHLWDQYSQELIAPFLKDGCEPTEYFCNMLRQTLIQDFDFKVTSQEELCTIIPSRTDPCYQAGSVLIDSLRTFDPLKKRGLKKPPLAIIEIQNFIEQENQKIQQKRSDNQRRQDCFALKEFFNIETYQIMEPRLETIQNWISGLKNSLWVPGEWPQRIQNRLEKRSPFLFTQLKGLTTVRTHTTFEFIPLSNSPSDLFGHPNFSKKLMKKVSDRYFEPIFATEVAELILSLIPHKNFAVLLERIESTPVTQPETSEFFKKEQESYRDQISKLQVQILESYPKEGVGKSSSYLYCFDPATLKAVGEQFFLFLKNGSIPLKFSEFSSLLPQTLQKNLWIWAASGIPKSGGISLERPSLEIEALHMFLEYAVVQKNSDFLNELLRKKEIGLKNFLYLSMHKSLEKHIPNRKSLLWLALEKENYSNAELLVTLCPDLMDSYCFHKNSYLSPLLAAVTKRNFHIFNFYVIHGASLINKALKSSKMKNGHILSFLNWSVPLGERYNYIKSLLLHSPTFSIQDWVSYKPTGQNKIRIPAYVMIAIYMQDLHKSSYPVQALEGVKLLLEHPSFLSHPIRSDDPSLFRLSTNFFSNIAFALSQSEIIEKAVTVGMNFFEGPSILMTDFLREIFESKNGVLKKFLQQEILKEGLSLRCESALHEASKRFFSPISYNPEALKGFMDFLKKDLVLPEEVFYRIVSLEKIVNLISFSVQRPECRQKSSFMFFSSRIHEIFSIIKPHIKMHWNHAEDVRIFKSFILLLWARKYFSLSMNVIATCAPNRDRSLSLDSSFLGSPLSPLSLAHSSSPKIHHTNLWNLFKKTMRAITIEGLSQQTLNPLAYTDGIEKRKGWEDWQDRPEDLIPYLGTLLEDSPIDGVERKYTWATLQTILQESLIAPDPLVFSTEKKRRDRSMGKDGSDCEQGDPFPKRIKPSGLTIS